MGQFANVEYLWKKCNQLMNTNYNQVINVEYVLKAANITANIIDDAAHKTEPDFLTGSTLVTQKVTDTIVVSVSVLALV
jgi:hypothetical protein